jgi:hypothetical protein
MHDVIVEARGGVIVEVYSSLPTIRVCVLDWDDIHEGDDPACWGSPTAIDEMPHDTREQYLRARARDTNGSERQPGIQA